jgi:monofunctional biosynthetic peptidoglycan transglycosylase
MKVLWRYVSWCVLAGLALQLFFFLRIVTMGVVAPESTAFMRSEIGRVAVKAVTGQKACDGHKLGLSHRPSATTCAAP